jgi:hypothetical protein
MSIRAAKATSQPAKRERAHLGKVYSVSQAHEIADRYDWLPEEQVQALAEVMQARGGPDKDNPIVRLPDGRVVDGRNRELISLVAGFEPIYETRDFKDEAEIEAFIGLRNGGRRHETEARRAMRIARQHVNSPLNQTQEARRAGISRESVKRALVIIRRGVPELAVATENGDLDLTTASQLANRTPEEQRVALATDNPKQTARDLIEGAGSEPLSPSGVSARPAPVRIGPDCPTVGPHPWAGWPGIPSHSQTAAPGSEPM